jgi:hypothetical protein
VAESFLDDARVDATLQRKSCPGVAEPVQGDAGEVVAAHPAEERFADCFGTKPTAVGLVEHEAKVGEVGADEQALLAHAVAVVPEDGDRRRVDPAWGASPHRQDVNVNW